VAFNPASVTGTNTTSGLTVTAGANVAPGTYNLTIRGTGPAPGNLSGTAPLAVTVTAAQGITATATNASAAPGATATSNVTLTRLGGYTGAVGLTVAGLPAGVTATFNPQSVTGTTSVLSLAVGAGVAAGTYTGTITAAGTGVTSATTTFTLQVTGGTGGNTVAAFRFCDQTALPTFLAFRNGTTGAWTPVTVGANNTYNVTFTGNTGGVAYAVPNGNGGADVTVQYYTAAEFPTVANQECLSNPATKSVTGTVAGLGAGQTATISVGGGIGFLSGLLGGFGGSAPGSVTVSANGAFTITDANAAATDLVAIRTTTNATTGQQTIDRVIVRRNVNPAAGGSVGPVLDFSAAEAVAPATAAYTIAGTSAGETLIATNGFQTANGGSASFTTLSALLGATNPVTVLGVPASLTQAGDFNSAIVFAFADNGAFSTTRGVFQFNRDIAARTITLGAAAAAPTFSTLATAPYLRLRAAGTWQADYPDAVFINYSQTNRDWTIIGSRGYLGAGNSYELDIPDLSGLAGFNNAWGLVAGQPTEYNLTLYSGFQALAAITEGATVRFAGRDGTINP
jgi:hypothetical protein